jgi:hypothetical protein
MATYTPLKQGEAPKLGTSGQDVINLQKLLNKQGAGLKEDGLYGPKTAEAYAKYEALGKEQKQYGMPDPNIPKATVTNPVIKNQQNIVSSTDAVRNKQNEAGVGIDNAVNSATGVYGTPVKDQAGNIVGVEKYDTQTGKPLSGATTTGPERAPTTGNIKDSVGNTYSTSMPEGLTYELPGLTNDKKWVFDSAGKPFVMDNKGNVTTDQKAESQYNTNVQYNKDIQAQDKMYEALKAGVSQAHQVVIDRIKQQSTEQKKAMTDLNERYLGSKKVAGFRTGSTEYTPEIAMGILKNEEESGIRRIQEIDDRMTIALAEAVSAKDSKDLALAEKRFEQYGKLQKAKQDAITEQYKLYIDNQKYIADTTKALEAEERATTDQAIQELKVAGDAYAKAYASATNKDQYVNNLATTLGLDRNIVLGEILNATPKPTKPKTTSTSTSPKTINYSSATIPSTIKDSILDDIKKDSTLTLQELYDAYPEVQSTYLKSIWDSLKVKPKASGGKTS